MLMNFIGILDGTWNKQARKSEAGAKANSCQNISRSIGTDYTHTKGGTREVIYKVTVTARR